MKLKQLVAVSLMGIATTSAHALLVTPALSGADLANTIAGTGLTISNVSYTGTLSAAGTFTDGLGSGIGISSGVLLTSGTATGAVGPNGNAPDGPGTFGDESTDNGLAGNAALTALSGDNTFDATILTFDFEFDGGNGGDLFVNYVFASEEYNEYVNAGVNDVFAFFLDGVNVATLPGGTPVSINTVNLGANAGLYNDNNDGVYDLEYDGFTDVLQVSVLGLSAGLHTMSFAIADGGDHILDSGVFIQANSFSNVPTPTDVAEPSSMILLLMGLSGLILQRKRTR